MIAQSIQTMVQQGGSWKAAAHIVPSDGPCNNDSCGGSPEDLDTIASYNLTLHQLQEKMSKEAASTDDS